MIDTAVTMRRLISIISVLALLVAGLGTPNLAQAKSKKKPKLETYDATEGEDDAIPDVVMPYHPTAPLKPRSTTTVVHHAAPKAAPAPVAAAAPARDYDLVPAKQTESIARRLVLVDRLIREFGRAYDYRIHTVKELETILNDLEGAVPATTAAVETLPPAPPVAAE